MAAPKKEMDKLEETIKKCTKCALHGKRLHAVPGEGSSKAAVFFIGEGPGAEEDKQGRPFVGRSGQFLREMIRTIGFKEEDVFIGNVVKCRPPENRDPQPEEIEACYPYLQKQLEIIQPKVIATLGRHSMARFLPSQTISKCHGRIYKRKDGVYIFPLYHPAVALYSPSQKEILLKDMQRLPALLKYIQQEKG